MIVKIPKGEITENGFRKTMIHLCIYHCQLSMHQQQSSARALHSLLYRLYLTYTLTFRAFLKEIASNPYPKRRTEGEGGNRVVEMLSQVEGAFLKIADSSRVLSGLNP